MSILIELAGWIGFVLVLGAYGLLSAGRLDAKSRIYQWMNVIGAGGFVVNTIANHAIPSATLNVIWMGIGVFALWRMGRVT